MSLSHAEVEAMDRDELVDAVVTLSQTVEDLDAEMDALRNRVDRRTTTSWDRLEALEHRIDELEAGVDDGTDDEIETLHRERVKLARRLTAVEEELDLDTDDVSRVADGRHTSPLYLLEHVGPEAVADHTGATLQRARTLLENRDRWGETRANPKYGPHRVLASSAHDLKTRLEDARGEDLQWRQVYVAMQKIADLGGDHVSFDEDYGDTTHYGKAIVWQGVGQG